MGWHAARGRRTWFNQSQAAPGRHYSDIRPFHVEQAITRDLIASSAPWSNAAPPAPVQTSDAGEDLSIKRGTRRLEERLIRLALNKTAGNRTHAARVLEISPRGLQYKIKEYAVDPLNPLSRESDDPPEK